MMERIIYAETMPQSHQVDFLPWQENVFNKIPDEHQDTAFIRFTVNVDRTVLVTAGYSA